ncbi:MAG TPA: hypothetical protein VF784_09420, partial [Anaerolineales bacterium]
GVMISILATVLALYLLLVIARSYVGLVEPSKGHYITPYTALVAMVAYWVVTPFAIFFGFLGARSGRHIAHITFLIITIVLTVSGYLSARVIAASQPTGGAAFLLISEVLLAGVPCVGVWLALRQFGPQNTKRTSESKRKVE